MTQFKDRPGEQRLAFDPAAATPGAGLVFIGHIATPWASFDGIPKNPREARERGGGAIVHVDAPYRAGLTGLEGFSHVIVLYWFDRSRRDVIVQNPKHVTAPRGVFALRSPVRPNPIAMTVARIEAIDLEKGTVRIDAIDCLDGTPLIDMKPYLPSIDAVPDARTP